jgi:SAM-dependent methyltransferase
MTTATAFDARDLEARVKEMYRAVAEQPEGEFHFEMGRALAERLGYDPVALDRVPSEAIASFAGVGNFLHLARPRPGETVVDLGSGSGMDSFLAARAVGEEGRVIGIDMTDAQLAKSTRLAERDGFRNVAFRHGHIERVPVEDAVADLVISNGVINLSPRKPEVFREIGRILRNGGRLAFADIVTETQLPEGITCDPTLWAACIGGAPQQDRLAAMIADAGLRVERIEDNAAYGFISDNARTASARFGVKSVSVVAARP